MDATDRSHFAVLFILDVSESMADLLDDRRRLDIAVECVNLAIARLRARSRLEQASASVSVVTFGASARDALGGWRDVNSGPWLSRQQTQYGSRYLAGLDAAYALFERAPEPGPFGLRAQVTLSDLEWDVDAAQQHQIEPGEVDVALVLGLTDAPEPGTLELATLAGTWPPHLGSPDRRPSPVTIAPRRRAALDSVLAFVVALVAEQTVDLGGNPFAIEFEAARLASDVATVAAEPPSREELEALIRPYFGAIADAVGTEAADVGLQLFLRLYTAEEHRGRMTMPSGFIAGGRR